MRIGFAILSAALGLATSSGRLPAAAEEPPTLKNCLVSLIEEAQVPSQEAGVIVSLKAKRGDAVTKGQLLVQMDDIIPKAEKDKAQGELDAASKKATSDVDIKYARAAEGVAYYTWQKNKEAYDKVKNSVPLVEVKRLELDYQRAGFQIQQAELEQKIAEDTAKAKAAEVTAADEGIAHRKIKSPLDGVVVEVPQHEGEWVKPGDPVMRILRMDRLRIEGFLNSAVYSPQDILDRNVVVSIKLAHKIQPEQFTGKVVFVSPLVEAGGDYRVWAEVDNRLVPGRTDLWLLRPGATATMTIDTK
ncbi:MAG TPA: HlyD family efflux transporter periplasmic adaptor subunit [Pirellulales bacterium]|jgi:macrolide-specific efflux system membrane fusion protein|nr:HlyD family efflux transporter periplasmic adaptor subunit [Pirellulales bacterium]